MFGITDLVTYIVGTIFIVLLPGPNSLYVVAVAGRYGIRKGIQGACGIFVGDAVLMLGAALGAASVLKAYPALFVLLKYSGAIYLAWIGLQMIRGAWKGYRTSRAAEAKIETPMQIDATNPFKRALLISLMNPKAILFFLSFFVQFVDPNYAYPALTFFLLGVILQVCSATYLFTLIFAGHYLADIFRKRRLLAQTATGGVGVMFIGFGAKLALSSLQ